MHVPEADRRRGRRGRSCRRIIRSGPDVNDDNDLHGYQEATDHGNTTNDLGSNPTVEGALRKGCDTWEAGAMGQRGTFHVRSQ